MLFAANAKNATGVRDICLNNLNTPRVRIILHKVGTEVFDRYFTLKGLSLLEIVRK